MKRFKTLTGIALGILVAASAATALAFEKPVKTAARDSLAAGGTVMNETKGSTPSGTQGNVVYQKPASAKKLRLKGKKAPAFDDKNIILTFGVMADSHIMSKSSTESMQDLAASLGTTTDDTGASTDVQRLATTVFHTDENMQKGLKYIEEQAGGALDCVVIPGDLTNTGTLEDAKKFYGIYKAGLTHSEIPLIFCTGNHDLYAAGGTQGEHLFETFDAAAFSADITKRGPQNSRHSVVNGIHFIQINALQYEVGDLVFTQEAHTFLQDELVKAAADGQDKPIFVLIHTSIPGTVSGSNCMSPDFPTLIWSTDELRECLEAYPQAIMLSGHTHYTQNSDRTIYQDDFTTINVGPMHYMIADYGFYNRGKGKSALPDEFEKHSQAMLMNVDKNGTVRIKRYDVGLLEQQGETWYVKAPGYEDSLGDFRSDRAQRPGPVFGTKDLTASVNGGKATLSFTKASGNGSQVYYYFVSVKDSAGNCVLEHKYDTDFRIVPQEKDMRADWKITLEDLKPGSYEVTVTACNVWNKMGDSQKVKVVIQ